MRIIGGALGGRRLKAPSGLSTRPTTDKVRQALFNILIGGLGSLPEQARVLDLYAGSGALGLEALSRGAARAVFVEEAPRALAALRENLRDLHLIDRAEVIPMSVERALLRLAGHRDAPFHYIFADPPYKDGLLPALLERLGASESPLTAADGVVVVEYARVKGMQGPGPAYGRLCRDDERCYGQTALSFYVPSGLVT